jgi:hypothetical protein
MRGTTDDRRDDESSRTLEKSSEADLYRPAPNGGRARASEKQPVTPKGKSNGSNGFICFGPRTRVGRCALLRAMAASGGQG